MLRSLSFTRCKKKEDQDEDLEPNIESVIEDYSQIDPSFKTQMCYVKLTAGFIRKELVINKGYSLNDFCERTINNILNRLGYTLKKVLKIKPLKKIPETDTIFANVRRKHQLANDNKRILRISCDVKAKVKIGNLSQGGYSRMQNAPIADDHDQHWETVLNPFGIYELNNVEDLNELFIIFGNSKETSDFIVDALELWWNKRNYNSADYDLLMIDLDNGKSVASNTKLFMKRIVEFAQYIGIPIQLVYYPPYHSKYNPIERVWAALEKYWNSFVLNSVEYTLKIAQQMTYKGLNPTVLFINKVYQTGKKISDSVVKELNKFISRNPEIPKWDVKISHKINSD